ncbi:hypothetical protein X777_01676 [Ooceraea biroi]|uniref:Uncharacterized protein n=1 Tax=Ooceraea biroi TaxID=2015173 RepID=A0A026WM01_OOCBI|nr:hypothetical protein X777_01676 [Ooceraea biroi]
MRTELSPRLRRYEPAAKFIFVHYAHVQRYNKESFVSGMHAKENLVAWGIFDEEERGCIVASCNAGKRKKELPPTLEQSGIATTGTGDDEREDGDEDVNEDEDEDDDVDEIRQVWMVQSHLVARSVTNPDGRTAV